MYKFNILEILSRNPETSQRDIANVCNISIGKVNYTINQLCLEEFLITEKSRNEYRYQITKRGQEYLKRELEHFQKTRVHKRKKINQAVILAAGNRPGFGRPAGLLNIHGMTLIERTIRILENYGINKIIIVTGYHKEMIEDFKSIRENSSISIVENPRYLWTGSMSSLARAADFINDDFILIEDDILIEEKAIIELLEYKERNCMLITKESGSGDEAFVELRNDYVYQISKDIHRLNRIDGEMIGVTKISYEVYQQMLRIFEHNRNPYINYEYMLLDVSRTVNLGYLKMSDIIWSEIDNQEHFNNVTDKVYALLRVKEEKFKENEIKQMIAEALSINCDLITSIEPLGGLTNRNYKMIIDSKECAVRLPGKGTEKYLNRSIEGLISEKASQIGINPSTIYFNEHTGLKVVQYISNAETLNAKTAKREENLTMIADILRKLHTSEEDFVKCFNVFEKITEYEKVLKNLNGKLLPGFDKVKRQVVKLKDEYDSFDFCLTPCHIDPLAENFVKSGEDKLYLIDWEYAGMNDPLWDVAAFTLESELTSDEEELFLLKYFNRKPDKGEMKRLLLNKIFQDFLWTIWALMKEANGEDFGSYAITRFTRARGNIAKYSGIQNEEINHVSV